MNTKPVMRAEAEEHAQRLAVLIDADNTSPRLADGLFEEIAKLGEVFSQRKLIKSGESFSFEVDDFRRHCLLNGLDDIGLTLQKAKDVETYESRQKTSQPWLSMNPG